MNEGKTVFSQIMDFIPIKAFWSTVHKYRGQHKIKSFSCLDQFYSMAFAQLTFRESLRDIEAAQNAANTALLKRIEIQAKKEILEKATNRAAKAQERLYNVQLEKEKAERELENVEEKTKDAKIILEERKQYLKELKIIFFVF